MLFHIFATLKKFIINIESAPPKPKDLIKFVRKGAKAPCKNSTDIGILHHALDWKLLTDLHDQYSLSPYLVFTPVHPDMVIFPVSYKTGNQPKPAKLSKNHPNKWHFCAVVHLYQNYWWWCLSLRLSTIFTRLLLIPVKGENIVL